MRRDTLEAMSRDELLDYAKSLEVALMDVLDIWSGVARRTIASAHMLKGASEDVVRICAVLREAVGDAS